MYCPKAKKGDLTEKEKIILGIAWIYFLGAEPKSPCQSRKRSLVLARLQTLSVNN
ncbi:hypothetical protein HD806DRAFT_531074 [Xylariaceae sp. AK1471]|nr:hypothetical protein HD806DRAFT_531074 [Xylariaceae sp. AK1471]